MKKKKKILCLDFKNVLGRCMKNFKKFLSKMLLNFTFEIGPGRCISSYWKKEKSCCMTKNYVGWNFVSEQISIEHFFYLIQHNFHVGLFSKGFSSNIKSPVTSLEYLHIFSNSFATSIHSAREHGIFTNNDQDSSTIASQYLKLTW